MSSSSFCVCTNTVVTHPRDTDFWFDQHVCHAVFRLGSLSCYNLASKALTGAKDDLLGRKSVPLESSQHTSKGWAAASVSDADRHLSSVHGSLYGAFESYNAEVSFCS